MARMRKRVTIRLTNRYVDYLNWLVEQGIYNSTGEAIRAGIRMLFEHHGIKLQEKSDLQKV